MRNSWSEFFDAVSSSRKAVSRSIHNVVSTPVVRYSAPVIGGASAIKAFRAWSSGVAMAPPSGVAHKRGHIARGKITPPGPTGRQNAANFSRPKMQQAMPRSKSEGIGEPLLNRSRHGWHAGIRHEQKVAARGQQRRDEVAGGN